MKTFYVSFLLLPLAGCISFGGKPPKQLMTLTATSTIAAGVTRTAGAGQTVTILSPSAPAAILAPRVPVYRGGTAIAYVKDAAWVESPVSCSMITSSNSSASTPKMCSPIMPRMVRSASVTANSASGPLATRRTSTSPMRAQ